LNNCQLLEYLLDTSSTVDEALLNLKKVRVSAFKTAGFESDLHWFLADPSGNSALIDFPDGKLIIHRHPKPPVITNSFYEHNKRYLSQFKGFGGKETIPLERGETTSENRYVFAAYSLAKAEKENKLTVSDVFNIMKSATQTNVRHASTSQSVTQWTAVYDLKDKKLSWFSRTNPVIRSIDLAKTDFSMSGKTRKMEF
jgi:choloylglycine hydrolase